MNSNERTAAVPVWIAGASGLLTGELLRLLEGHESLHLKGKLRCVETSYIGNDVNVRLEMALKWVKDDRTLESASAGHAGRGESLSGACDALMSQHGERITKVIVAKSLKAFAQVE